MREGRGKEELRNFKFYPNYLKTPEGSCLFEIGNTIVLATATIETKVPPFLRELEEGWVTAEYFMHPRATPERNVKDLRGKDGRSIEISRLISRSLRGACDRKKLKDYTIIIDCEVLQADGGTRTACINAGFVALYIATRYMIKNKLLDEDPIDKFLGSISVGKINGEIYLDLSYEEDLNAEFDLNISMLEDGKIVDIQGTAEKGSLNKEELIKLIDVAKKGIDKIIEEEKKILSSI